MALTVTEASAVNQVLRHFLGPEPHSLDRRPTSVRELEEALCILARGSYKRLKAGRREQDVKDAFAVFKAAIIEDEADEMIIDDPEIDKR